MGRISIFCDHTIPTEHPNAVRLANIGRIMAELGHDVHLYGYDVQEKAPFEYKGITCHVLKNLRLSGDASLVQFEAQKKKDVKRALQENPPTMIISVLQNCKAQRLMLSYARKNKIRMVQSVCEWFDRSNFSGIKGLVKLLNNRYSLRVQYPKEGNIIIISELLERYYESRHCRTVILPTLVDMREYEAVSNAPKQPGEVLKIAYAGSPAKKDYVANAIRAVALLRDEERKRVQLHFYGPEKKQLSALGIPEEFLEEYNETIICHGRIPYEQVKAKIAEADFTVLLRPDKRYANAGFPTKVGESMACGTPVIANLTSDLHKYIIDGQTGIVCRDETPESCAEALRRALSLTAEQRMQMHEQCLEMAKKAFDYHAYLDAMDKFLKK